MKPITRLLSLAFITVALTACDSDSSSKYKTTFFGGVEISKSEIKNGESVTINIGSLKAGNVEISTDNTINGKNGIAEIEYLLDDKIIGTSSNKESGYSITYNAEGLNPGTYTVTATCIPMKNWEITSNIGSAKLTVTE